MTAHTPPAARRRNAHLIATCAQLAADVNQAAAAVYSTIAAAPHEPVVVSGREIYLLAISATARLDHAVELDNDAWPAAAQAEREERARSARARAVLADAAAAVDTEPAVPADLVVGPAVPEMTHQQWAALEPASAIEDLLTGDEITPDRVRTVAADYELPVAELLAGAVTQHTATACLALQEAADRATGDPAAGAELALGATPHLVAAVRIASLDV